MAVHVWKRVRETWLSRKPSPVAGAIAALSVLLLVIGAVVYLQNFFNAQEWMPASKETVFGQGQWWRLWTTLFAHADTGHLLSNIFLFFIMGFFLTGYFGVFVFPVAAIFLGGLTNLLVLLSYPPEIKLIGASGVVYWLGGAWLALYFLIDQKRTYFQRFLRAGGVSLGVFWPATTFDPNISYGAHLIGFVLGLVFGVLYYAFKKQTFKEAIVYDWIVDEDEDTDEKHLIPF
ncbi:MAG: rhomboid family intramembrane serine protease [Bdellovibrio sp.]